jgi:hypothetical protein
VTGSQRRWRRLVTGVYGQTSLVKGQRSEAPRHVKPPNFVVPSRGCRLLNTVQGARVRSDGAGARVNLDQKDGLCVRTTTWERCGVPTGGDPRMDKLRMRNALRSWDEGQIAGGRDRARTTEMGSDGDGRRRRRDVDDSSDAERVSRLTMPDTLPSRRARIPPMGNSILRQMAARRSPSPHLISSRYRFCSTQRRR